LPVIKKNSPNQTHRVHGDDAVRLVVCHTPEGTWAGTISTIMNPKTQVSYHEMVSKNGREIVVFVPWDRKAWHALALNDASDGIAIEGYARHFDLDDDGVPVFAREVARRLVARKLKPQWTTDTRKGGFCRHGDLQSNRTDPTPDLKEWRLFVEMVKDEYEKLTDEKPKKIPPWFYHWMRWRLGGRKWRRPGSAPRVIPLWAWKRYAELSRAKWLR
jgi:N-acetyl-anhydromuramyl-L-alanine amidase AmpD